MRATELMLGSYVSVVPSGMIIKVAAIHKYKVGYRTVTNKLEWVRISLVRPIPITPELLRKVGFGDKVHDKSFYSFYNKKSDEWTYAEYNHYSATVSITGGSFTLENKENERAQKIECIGCRYLHELQNHFATFDIKIELNN